MTGVCADCGQRINPDVDAEQCVHCAARDGEQSANCSRTETPTDIDMLERKAKQCRCEDCRHIVSYINGTTR